jgi:hypothetical protein
MKPLVSVIIATSMQRTPLLVERSLPSVYNQKAVEPSQVEVLVVDDNVYGEAPYSLEYHNICSLVDDLRKNVGLSATDFPTYVLPNYKTRGNSGTGAWNTGFETALLHNSDGFVSILDDDDEYLDHHLQDCLQRLKANTWAVFQRMKWINADNSTMDLPLTIEKLEPVNFFIGNPGVQGSNMFFKTSSVMEIGGFDETFPNTTDRDLMIRYLWNTPPKYIEVIEAVGVLHYNHKEPKVNTNLPLKQIGLDKFYKKYRHLFSQEAYELSIERAKKFFDYKPNHNP